MKKNLEQALKELSLPKYLYSTKNHLLYEFQGIETEEEIFHLKNLHSNSEISISTGFITTFEVIDNPLVIDAIDLAKRMRTNDSLNKLNISDRLVKGISDVVSEEYPGLTLVELKEIYEQLSQLEETSRSFDLKLKQLKFI